MMAFKVQSAHLLNFVSTLTVDYKIIHYFIYELYKEN